MLIRNNKKFVTFKSRFIVALMVVSVLITSSCNRTTIQIHAAVVYKFDGAKPVARTKFYLLTKSFDEFEKEKGFAPYTSARSSARGKMIDDRLGMNNDRTPGIDEVLLKETILSVVVTDFEGKAVFENVPNGVSYIAGYTETRKENESLVWCVKVDTTKLDGKPLILDQNNAVVDTP